MPPRLFHMYTLVGKIAVPCLNVLEWGKWMGANHNQVRVGHDYLRYMKEEVECQIRVSTVFLGLDHNLGHRDMGDPLLFETMVFGGPNDQLQERYHTWDEAEIGHAKILEHEKAWILMYEEG